MPEYVDIGNATAGDGSKPTLSSGSAVVSTVGLNGLKVTNATSGGTITDATDIYYLVTRKDTFRGLEEGIS
ncbi:MAG: hypothetical protein ACREP9_10365 [Candidatus Dormibacteraceae bacterium]